MPTKLEIYKQALSLIGGDVNITTMNEKSNPNLIHCNAWEETARHSVLRAHPWKWATYRVELDGPEEGDKPTKLEIGKGDARWPYRYYYPKHCIKLVKMAFDDRRNSGFVPPPFKVEYYNDEGNEEWANRDYKAVYTDVGGDNRIAQAIVTLKAGDAVGGVPPYAAMTEDFSSLMAIKLASLIAYPVTKKNELAAKLEAMYERKKMKAIMQDGEDQQDIIGEASWILARGGGSVASEVTVDSVGSIRQGQV